MDGLYEQMDFILSGGALNLLVDFLASRVKAALILEPRDADLEVLDAVGVQTKGLLVKEKASKLASFFPSHIPAGKFETDFAAIEGDWPWAIRIHGIYWTIYVLLREKPEASLLSDMQPAAGLISLWQTFQHFEITEARLSRLSYIVLATKNTLAAIFEPMPITYYAAFLSDVLRESLFPRSISIFKDDGGTLTFLEGDEIETPERKGIFAEAFTPPVPRVVQADDHTWRVVLPIPDENRRLFCLGEWDHALTEETLNFLELFGNLAARALSTNRLQFEGLQKEEKVSSADFAIFSLSKALSLLQEQKTRESLLKLSADVVSELVPKGSCFFAAWDQKSGAYVPAAFQKKGIATPFSSSALSAAQPFPKNSGIFFDLSDTKTSERPPYLDEALSLWPEMEGMRYIFLLQVNDRTEGFIALEPGSEATHLPQNSIAALQIMAQCLALELRQFDDR